MLLPRNTSFTRVPQVSDFILDNYESLLKEKQPKLVIKNGKPTYEMWEIYYESNSIYLKNLETDYIMPLAYVEGVSRLSFSFDLEGNLSYLYVKNKKYYLSYYDVDSKQTVELISENGIEISDAKLIYDDLRLETKYVEDSVIKSRNTTTGVFLYYISDNTLFCSDIFYKYKNPLGIRRLNTATKILRVGMSKNSRLLFKLSGDEYKVEYLDLDAFVDVSDNKNYKKFLLGSGEQLVIRRYWYKNDIPLDPSYHFYTNITSDIPNLIEDVALYKDYVGTSEISSESGVITGSFSNKKTQVNIEGFIVDNYGVVTTINDYTGGLGDFKIKATAYLYDKKYGSGTSFDYHMSYIKEIDLGEIDPMGRINGLSLNSHIEYDPTTKSFYYIKNRSTGIVKYKRSGSSIWEYWETPIEEDIPLSIEVLHPEFDFTNPADVVKYNNKVKDIEELYIESKGKVLSGSFKNMPNLRKVHVNYEEIESDTFINCPNINSIHILEYVHKVNKNTFNKLTQIDYLTFNTVNPQLFYIDAYAFDGSVIKDLHIPKSVTSHGTHIVKDVEVPYTGILNCKCIGHITTGALKTIDAIDWLGTIAKETKGLTFPDGVENIYGSWNIIKSCKELTFGNTVKNIGRTTDTQMFRDIGETDYLKLPATVDYVSDYAFSYLIVLREVNLILNENTILGANAFRSLSYSLQGNGTRLYLNKVKEIGLNCFASARVRFNDSTSLVISKYVKVIKDEAFYSSPFLYELSFENGCEAVIGKDAFSNNTNLTSVHIGDTVKEIQASFRNLSYCQKLYIGKGITKLYNNEFENYGRYVNTDYSKHVFIIPDNVEYILGHVLVNSDIGKLIVSKNLKQLGGKLGGTDIPSEFCIKEIYMRCPTAPSGLDEKYMLGDYETKVFVSDIKSYRTVINYKYSEYTPPLKDSDGHFPTNISVKKGTDWDVYYLNLMTGEKVYYKSPTPGIVPGLAFNEMSDYIDDICINSTVHTIGASAFRANPSIKRIQFVSPSNLLNLGPYAFKGSGEQVEYLFLPESIERMGKEFISPLTNIKELTFSYNKLISVGAQISTQAVLFPPLLSPPNPKDIKIKDNILSMELHDYDELTLQLIKNGVTTPLGTYPYTTVYFSLNFKKEFPDITLEVGDYIEIVLTDVVNNVSEKTGVYVESEIT